MTQSKKQNKKVLTAVLAVALVAVMAIGASLAFLTDKETATNKFTVGDIDIDLDEDNWDPDEGLDVEPGKTIAKDPTLSWASGGDSYARIIVKLIDQNDTMPNPDYVDEETTPGEEKTIANTNKGKVITDTDRIDAIMSLIYNDPDGDLDLAESYELADIAAYLGFNTTDFELDNTYSSASTLYYNYIADDGLLSDGESATLFTNVVFPTDYEQDTLQLIGKFDIDLVAQAIQTTGFDTAADAYAQLEIEMA